jgi:hypothetical protein
MFKNFSLSRMWRFEKVYFAYFGTVVAMLVFVNWILLTNEGVDTPVAKAAPVIYNVLMLASLVFIVKVAHNSGLKHEREAEPPVASQDESLPIEKIAKSIGQLKDPAKLESLKELLRSGLLTSIGGMASMALLIIGFVISSFGSNAEGVISQAGMILAVGQVFQVAAIVLFGISIVLLVFMRKAQPETQG